MPRAKTIAGLAGWLIFAFAFPAEADPPESPFVAGFERFGRHDEISQLTAGVLLATELNCTSCHAANIAELNPKRGPRLDGVGNRLHAAWIKQLLAAPEKTKPGTTMPNLFTDWPEQAKNEAIAALVAFLGSRHEPFPVLKATGLHPIPFEFWNKGDQDRGKQLFHQVGCVACHEPDKSYDTVDVKPSPVDQLLEQLSPEELKEMGLSGKARRVKSVPHANLPQKYTRQSLTFFLLNPEKTRPSKRMPNLNLEPVEAADLAAYLLREQDPAIETVTKTDAVDLIEKGKRLYAELGCINCHEASDDKEKRLAKPWAELSTDGKKTCLGSPAKGLPHYALDETQQAALAVAIKDWEKARFPKAQDRLENAMLRYNCLACHERGGLGGVGRFRKPYFETRGHIDLGDEGRLPPPLDRVGSKLNRESIKKVLQGESRIRPFLKARMPKYSNSALPLVGFFAGSDNGGLKVASESTVFGDLKGLAAAGRDLMDQGCVQCHSFRGEALPGVVGVDLAGATARMQPSWFHEFLKNPAAIKPRTRMPTFFPGGKSQNETVLNGETDRQIAAMWAYLKELDKQKLPAKIEEARSKDYELKPADRPIVLRTFMKEAGTQAIAVGFPQKVHFAFDAEVCRPVIAWRGRFLDAEGTWFSRFTPPADPLGDNLIRFPHGLPFAELKNAMETWPKADPLNPAYQFQGYRLDQKGVPTFLYRSEHFEYEDRYEPIGKQELQRRLTVINRKPNVKRRFLWFRPTAGNTLKRGGDLRYKNDTGLAVSLDKTIGHAGELRQTESGTEWIIPLEIKATKVIQVKYRW